MYARRETKKDKNISSTNIYIYIYRERERERERDYKDEIVLLEARGRHYIANSASLMNSIGTFYFR